jgi:hypothetical protein
MQNTVNDVSAPVKSDDRVLTPAGTERADEPGPGGCWSLKRDGTPCSSPVYGEREYCTSHSGKGFDSERARAAQERQARSRAERREARRREREMTFRDVLAAELRPRYRELAAAMIRSAIEGDGGAQARVLDRLFGRPTERVETVSSGPAVDLAAMTDAELAEYEARLAAEYPDLIAELVGRAGGSGETGQNEA